MSTGCPAAGYIIRIPFIIAILTLPLHWFTDAFSNAVPLTAPKPWSAQPEDSFQNEGVYSAVDNAEILTGLKTYGSWLGDDKGTGKIDSPRYDLKHVCEILVAGHPNSDGNSLIIEFQKTDGQIDTTLYPMEDPGTRWKPLQILPDPQVTKFRIQAVDGRNEGGGWLAVSEPYRYRWNGWIFVAKILSIFCIAWSALVIPGLVFFALLDEKSFWRNFIFVAVPGLVDMAFCGLVLWYGGKWFNVHSVAFLLIVIYLVLLSYPVFMVRWSKNISVPQSAVLTLSLLVGALAVGRATISHGPEGELFGGTVSRSLEVGLRSDSRISYHNVQLAAHRLHPHQPEGEKYFKPWSFSSRGPVAGLAAAPIVLLGTDKVPLGMPDHRWMPFDEQGFASYRIFMIVVSSLVLFILFGFLESVWGTTAGILGVAVLIFCPFFIHELYFSWPKPISSGFTLIAVYLLLQKRLILSGVALAGAFLLHPAPLLCVPFFLIGLFYLYGYFGGTELIKEKRSLADVIPAIASFMMGLTVPLLIWYALNWGHFGHSYFLQYPFMSEYDLFPGWGNWLTGRMHSLLNTTVPSYFYFQYGNYPDINNLSRPAHDAVHFCLQYWYTLPFAFGIVFFVFLIPNWFKQAYLNRRTALLFLAFPFFFFWLYWGGSTSGFLPENGHILFFGLVIFVVWGLDPQDEESLKSRLLNKAFLSVRLIECFIMMFLPAIFAPKGGQNPLFWSSDVMSFLVVVGAGILMIYTLRRALPITSKGAN